MGYVHIGACDFLNDAEETKRPVSMNIDWKKVGPLLSNKEAGPEPSLDHIIRSYYQDRLEAAHSIKVAKWYMNEYDQAP